MPEPEVLESWIQIGGFIDARDTEALVAYLGALTPGEVARALSRLDEDRHRELVALLGPEAAADLIEELSDTQGSDLVEGLETSVGEAIVEEM